MYIIQYREKYKLGDHARALRQRQKTDRGGGDYENEARMGGERVN